MSSVIIWALVVMSIARRGSNVELITVGVSTEAAVARSSGGRDHVLGRRVGR